jgi:amidophosphoribosyltransferase
MCGIVGVYGHPEAANITYLGLHALQHRGQESAGIVSSDGERLYSSRHMGLVGEVFTEQALAKLPGTLAIGHVRYSTTGSSVIENAQPFAVDYQHGSIALGHNGNLVNADELRTRLEREGSIFRTSSDTEIIVHLLARSKEPDLVARLSGALAELQGAYSLVLCTQNELVAVRDPMGFRPLALGRLKDSFVVASESCAFDLIEAEFIREIEPGEMIIIGPDGLKSHKLPFAAAAPRHVCVFEHVYFARPDSIINGRSVYRVRENMGRRLAQEHPVPADVVIPVPDSGMAAAIGYARESKIPYDLGLMRSHYVGRTFIEPSQSIRHFGVRLKLNPVREVLDGKRVVVIDDSIVRGTTSRKIVKLIRSAGAREVHLRISSPPTIGPCYYGIDTPTRSELIASSHSVEEIMRYITCDSLGYLSHEGMMQSVGAPAGGTGYCSACFTGNYPVPFREQQNKAHPLKLIRNT